MQSTPSCLALHPCLLSPIFPTLCSDPGPLGAPFRPLRGADLGHRAPAGRPLKELLLVMYSKTCQAEPRLFLFCFPVLKIGKKKNRRRSTDQLTA